MTGTSDPGSGSEADAASAHAEAEPRDWHYAFAHRSLRDIYFEQTEKLLAALSDPERTGRVPEAILRKVALDIDRPEDEVLGHADGISIFRPLLGDGSLHIIGLPAPVAPLECHFVGLLHDYPGAPALLYFTLEKGAEDESFLCRWDENGNHLNLGHVAEPTLDAFVDAISANIPWESHDAAASGAARESDTAGPAGSRWFGRGELNAETLHALLDQAAFEVTVGESRKLHVQDYGVSYHAVFPEHSDEYFTLYAWWDLDEGWPRSEWLEAVNRINAEYLYLRAFIGSDGGLCLIQNIPLLSGVTDKYVIQVMRKFAGGCREAVDEARRKPNGE